MKLRLRLKEELRFGYCSGKQHNLMFFLEHNAGRLRPLLCGLVFLFQCTIRSIEMAIFEGL